MSGLPSTDPPPIMLLLVAMLLVVTATFFSRVGARFTTLPLWILVGSQVFRLPLELVMHRASDVGLMPVQMSFSGWNFDILSGLLAVPARETWRMRQRAEKSA